MAHHGDNPFGDLSNEGLKKLFEQGSKDVFRKSMPADQAERINDLLKNDPLGNQLGATGRHTDGKLNEEDKGEIMIGVTSIEDRIVINFGKPVHWVGLTKEQAKQIALRLQSRAGFSMTNWMKSWLDAYDKANNTDMANSIMNWCNEQPTTNG